MINIFDKISKDIRPEDEDLSVQRLFTLINLDSLFVRTPEAKVINNETLVSQKLSKDFTDAIYSNSDGELGFVPSCQCGKIKGVSKVGLYCPQCGTICSAQFVDHLGHISWIEIPLSMAPVLHPIWYMILKAWTSVGRRDLSVVDIILNPAEEIPEDLVAAITGRGFQYFYEHADEIIHFLLYKYPKTAKKPMARWIVPFLTVYREAMFTRHLPILHNSLHPLKCNGGTLNYVDSVSKDILAAIIDLSTETFKLHATTVSPRSFNRTMYDIYRRIIEYYQGLINEKLGGKPALLRKHCYGSRVHFSMRSVVVPHTSVKPMDCLVLPWGIIVNCLKLPILNKLMTKYHKSFGDAYTTFMKSLVKYDETIHKCVQDFISESEDSKMACLLGRNPTLNYGSIVLLYTRPQDFTIDPSNHTIGLPPGIIQRMNEVAFPHAVMRVE